MKKSLAMILFAASSAHAGGLTRPTGGSARGTGMGGAWNVWADDATAVYFNPAALDNADPEVEVGGEYVYGPRSYTPILDDGSKGPAQTTNVAAGLPVLGVIGRLTDEDDRPSRFTIGGAVYNSYGGNVSYAQTGMPALDKTEDAVIEAAVGTSFRASDRLSLGASLRLGIGLFALDATQDPYDAHLSATGVGGSFALGALFKPTDDFRIGVAWRAPMNVSTDGSGTLTLPAGMQNQSVSHDQHWPQSASLALGYRAAPGLKLTVQGDWTQWSELKELTVRFPANASLDQVFREDWKDNWTARVGGEYAWDAYAVRAGAYADTNAVPDRTIERQYLDLLKGGVSVGGTVRASGWRIDGAFDGAIPNTRTVPNNHADTAAFPADRNKSPGVYKGTLFTFELSVAHGF
ncbi:MAG: outer membrane protein transport protein [Deltaproteobacteria bacterium]|nr:outer membrane protein transport protein [Deltaproteobacteria bacterium]